MIDKETWKFINTFAPWFSALGTLLAVSTSLYLATRDRSIRIKVSAGRRLRFYGGPQGINVITIYVVNKGHRNATITGLYWRYAFNKKITFEQAPPVPNLSTLPIKLEDGDEATYAFPEDEFSKEIKHFSLVMPPSKILWLKAKFIKVGVYTSTGLKFESSIEPALQKFFIETINKSIT